MVGKRLRTRSGEVEVIFKRLSRIRGEAEPLAVDDLAAIHRDRALRDLQKQVHDLRARQGIGDDHICAIDDAGKELAGDVFL